MCLGKFNFVNSFIEFLVFEMCWYYVIFLKSLELCLCILKNLKKEGKENFCIFIMYCFFFFYFGDIY